MRKYDMVIIGSGAGLMVMEAALGQGLTCAIVESAKIGGTCLTKGCIPSKMLVYPADFIRETQEVSRIGLYTEAPRINWETISRRMWEQIDYHYKIEKNLQNIPNLTLFKGAGSFIGPNALSIQYSDGRPDEIIQGEKFVIAAGARSYVPPIEGLENCGYLTSETFFGEKHPKSPWSSLVIIGGGAISAEFAHIFSAFGTKVTVIERSGRILSKEEPEISQFVARQFKKKGIDIFTDSSIVSVSRDDTMKYITVQNNLTKEQTIVACEEIFVASGIQSNSDTLSLKNAGVAVDQRGWILTNPYLETSQKHIWALGDINGKYQFRHKANHEAQVLIKNLFQTRDAQELEQVNYTSVPWTIFTHPQVAHVGMTEAELQQKGIPYRTAYNHYSEVVGGRAMGYKKNDDDNGFVKMIVGENKKILGVHIIGPQAGVLLQPFVYLMNAGFECKKKCGESASKQIEGLRILCPNVGTYAPINDSMVIHPSLNELTAWVFEKLDMDA